MPSVSSPGGGGSDASTTVKGIVKLSAAPASASEPIAVGDNDSRLARPTKRVTLPIAADNSGTTSGFTGALQRWAIQLPVTTTRWRLKIRNTGGSNPGDITLSDIYLGTPTFSNGAWAGAIAASPTNVLSGLSMPNDTTELTTSWVSGASDQFAPDVMRVISMDFACLSSVNLTKSSNTGYMRYRTTGSGLSGDVAVATPATGSLSNTTQMLDVRLEYEYAGQALVGLFVGDSITCGYDDTGTAPNVPGPVATWPAQAALRQRFTWINAGVGGTAMGDWTSTSNAKYTRLDLTTTVPDFAVIALGVNDANGGVTAATFKTNTASVITALKALGINRIYIATVVPQPRWKPGVVLAGQASGSATLQTSVAYANAEVVDVDYEYSSLKETLTVSGASTGTQAPYTTTFTANTTKNHSQGATINLSTTESRRLDYNQFIRSLPAGCEAVLDFARAIGASGQINVGDPASFNYGAATIHPGSRGWALMAAEVNIPSLNPLQ